MPGSPRIARALALGLLVVAPAAGAVTRPPGETARAANPPDVVSTGDARRQAALSRGPAWRAFRARHGSWSAVWNERTETPHLAIGPPIRLPGFRDDAPSVDRALRGFLGAHRDLFGDPTLEMVRAQRVRNLWYVSYRQTVGGVPVLFEDWEFRVALDGRLATFGVDAHRVDPGTRTRPLLSAAAARAAARVALGANPATDRVEGGERRFLLPRWKGDRHEYRLVAETRVRTAAPRAHWVVLVDDESGEVVWRHDRVRHAIEGSVTGSVHLLLPTETPTPRPFQSLNVTVGAATATTTPGGTYSSSASGTVTVSARIEGPFCNVDRLDAPDAWFSTSATDPATVNVAWSDGNSHPAERDAFYHLNLAHAHVKGLDPGFVGNDYAMPADVNLPLTCNAFWDGFGVGFYQAGGGCPNTATMPDVVYHEYGHGVNDNLYVQAGSPFGMVNGALHEGLADVFAAFLQDDPLAGKGFTGPGTWLRRLDNTARWPEDASGDPHITGLILAGALWDLRQSLGLAAATRLAHYARYALPDDFNDGQAMKEYFLGVLLADDDDADLSNGTPNAGAIAAAFNAHGIGTNLFLAMNHFALSDPATLGPNPVSALIVSSAPFGGLDPSSPAVHYSVDGGPFITVPMLPSDLNEFTGEIPSNLGSIVRYWISAADQFGGTITDPPNPTRRTHLFLNGPTLTYYVHDHESNAGWTPGAPGDDATTGQWEWVEPDGTFVGGVPVQPEEDHTPYGILCYVTANCYWPPCSPGSADVDGGRTTLLTGPIDVTVAGPNPLLEYYRWYSNNMGGAPETDLWRVDISGDGGFSWVNVETTHLTDNSWRRVVFFVKDYVTPTDFIMVRFVAEDAGEPSLVEAGVDDLRLLAFDVPLVGVASRPPGPALSLGPPSPNPFGGITRLRYALPSRAEVTLRVFDPAGRLVRTLARGSRDTGHHVVGWDGTDEAGRPVGSGVYLAKLTVGAQEMVRRLVRVR